eukprot:Em0010g392a
MSAEITKKKRIRAGHKASVAKITAQIKTELGTSERNILRLQQLRKKLQEKSRNPTGPSFLFDRPIDDDPTLEEATLKECASELKVNDRLQFEEVHSLLVTRPRKNAAETARLKMTLQIKDLEEPDSEVD